MKKNLSIGIALVLTLVLLPVVLAEETITAPGVVDLTSYATNLETAQKEEGYARTNYYLTTQIENPAAIIEYYRLYHPTEDISVLVTYYNNLRKLQSDMTINSDFNAIIAQARVEEQKAGAAMYKAVKQYYTETPAIKGYIYNYRDTHTENDGWHTTWGLARAQTVYARTDYNVADISNTVALAEYYTPTETTNIATLESYISQMESIGTSWATAVQSFDETRASSLSSQMQSVKTQADTLADQMWDNIFEAWRELNGP